MTIALNDNNVPPHVLKKILKRAPVLFAIAKKMKSIVLKIFERSVIRRKLVKVVDIPSWCRKNHMSIDIIEANRKMYVNKPMIFATGNQSYSFSFGEAGLPDIYLARLRNVTVIEGSDLVIAKHNTALYDEVALDKEGKYGLRITPPLLKERYVEKNELFLMYKKNLKSFPKQAIHFCKDHSNNYFHWLVECLPRMWIVEQFKELDTLPLLVDSHLKSQQLESLKILTGNKREIIQLKHWHGYAIKNLFYPSSLSVMHDNYDHPIAYDKDVLISPLAIQYLRSKFLSLIDLTHNHEEKKSTKIYLSRKKLGNQRRLLNDDEIESMLTNEGFDIVCPEMLSFVDQVKLFSQAEIIVSATGSALANMIFAKENCKVFVLYSNQGLNPYLFTMIANSINCELYSVIGEQKMDTRCRETHHRFVMDVNVIKSAFQAYL